MPSARAPPSTLETGGAEKFTPRAEGLGEPRAEGRGSPRADGRGSPRAEGGLGEPRAEGRGSPRADGLGEPRAEGLRSFRAEGRGAASAGAPAVSGMKMPCHQTWGEVVLRTRDGEGVVEETHGGRQR